MESKELGPNPNALYPNEQIKSICYIKNAITRDNIIVGDYTYYDDINGAEMFEERLISWQMAGSNPYLNYQICL